MCISLILLTPSPFSIQFIIYAVLSHIHFCHNYALFYVKLFWLKSSFLFKKICLCACLCFSITFLFCFVKCFLVCHPYIFSLHWSLGWGSIFSRPEKSQRQLYKHLRKGFIFSKQKTLSEVHRPFKHSSKKAMEAFAIRI